MSATKTKPITTKNAKGPDTPTPIGAAAYRKQVEQGMLWTAPSGAVIRMRDLAIVDRVLIDSLPQHLQEIVGNIIDRSDALSGDDETDDNTRAMDAFGGEERTLRSTYDNLTDLGNHFAVAAWIEPEVVPTEADVTDPDRQIPATLIPRDDRMAFVGRILGMDVQGAQQMAGFPAQSDGSV